MTMDRHPGIPPTYPCGVSTGSPHLIICEECKKASKKTSKTPPTGRMLPGAKRPMNQPTPAMEAVSLLQSIIMGFQNHKEGLIDAKLFIARLEDDIDEAKVLIKFLGKNEWPKT